MDLMAIFDEYLSHGDKYVGIVEGHPIGRIHWTASKVDGLFDIVIKKDTKYSLLNTNEVRDCILEELENEPRANGEGNAAFTG